MSGKAAAGRVDRGYLATALRLTLLALDIVEAILDGRQPPELGLEEAASPHFSPGAGLDH